MMYFYYLIVLILVQSQSNKAQIVYNPEEPTDSCITPSSEYNIQTLIRPPYWRFKLNSGCSVLTNSSQACTINVAFCKELNLDSCKSSSTCIEYNDQNSTLIAGNFTRDPFTIEGFRFN